MADQSSRSFDYLEEFGNRWDWIVGMCLYAVGSVVINLGTNLMKYSHLKNEALPLAQQKKAFLQKYWQIGMGIFLLGNLLNFSALSFAAQSLLAAVGAIQFISNIVFATCVLKEKLTPNAIFGTFAIVSGNVFIVISATHQSTDYSVQKLLTLYTRLPFIIYFILVVLTAAAFQIVYVVIRRGVINGRIKRNSFWNVRIMPLSYAAVSAMIGTHTVILGKSCSSLVRLQLQGQNQLYFWFTYVIIGSFLGLTIFWMVRLNTAIRKFSAIYIIPALQVIWITFSIVGGGIYFEEFNHFDAFDISCFLVGAVILLFGVHFLAPKREDEEENVKDVELVVVTPATTELPVVINVTSGEVVVLDSSGEHEHNGPLTPLGGPEISLFEQFLAMENFPALTSFSALEFDDTVKLSASNPELVLPEDDEEFQEFKHTVNKEN